MTSASARFYTRRKKRSIALTPLIDVIFILLLFFMLSTSFQLDRRIAVDTGDESVVTDDVEPRVVLLRSNEEFVEFQDISYAWSDPGLASALRRAGEEAAIVVDVLDGVHTQTLVSFLELLSDAGFERLVMAPR